MRALLASLAIVLPLTSAYGALALDPTANPAGAPITFQISQSTTNNTLPTPAFTTSGGPRLLVVIVSAESGAACWPFTVTDSAGLVWKKRIEKSWTAAFVAEGGSAVFTAWAPSTLVADIVTATRTGTTSGAATLSGLITVWAVIPVLSTEEASIGATGGKESATGSSSTVDATVNVLAAGSWLFGAFYNGNSGTIMTARANTSAFDTTNHLASSDMAHGRLKSAGTVTTTSGPGNVTIGATDSQAFYATAALEILSVSLGTGGMMGFF